MPSETFWQLEHTQTIANIKASQFRFWFKQAFCLWFLGSLFSLMMGLSEPAERKENALVWLIASVTFTDTVAWHGGRYGARELARWMDETIYQGTVGQWAWWAAGCGLLPVALMGMGGWWHLKRKRTGEQHIRGAEVVSVEELQQRLRRSGPLGRSIAGVQIPAALECEHSVVCGATGAGKSEILQQMIAECEERGEVCVIVDPGGQLTSWFYNPGRGDYLNNSVDARCPWWTPWQEGESEADIARVASCLFPIWDGMQSAAAFYHSVAQRAYREILGLITDQDPRKISQVLTTQGKKLNIPREVIPTLLNACDAFRYLQPADRSWSAREWVKNPQGWVFLTFRNIDRAVLPIISLQLELLFSELLSRPIGRGPRINVFIDELAALKVQPGLAEMMSEARKREVSVALGFQDKKRLDALYGEALTDSILAQPATRFLMKTNEPSTQEWSAKNIGNREMLRFVESETVGSMDGRDAMTRRPDRKTEEAVMASEFGQLPTGVGYLKVAEYGTSKVRVRHKGREEKELAFIPRQEEKGVDRCPPPSSRVVSKERRAL